jgi:hypothetical protein
MPNMAVNRTFFPLAASVSTFLRSQARPDDGEHGGG